VHHVVATPEEISDIPNGWKEFLEATFGWVLTCEDAVFHGWKRGEDGLPPCEEGVAENLLRWVTTILRDAECAVLEVLVGEGHDDFSISATDELENAIRVNREVTDAERGMVHALSRHLAEALSWNGLHQFLSVADGVVEAGCDERASSVDGGSGSHWTRSVATRHATRQREAQLFPDREMRSVPSHAITSRTTTTRTPSPPAQGSSRSNGCADTHASHQVTRRDHRDACGHAR
jgi:hypothetical protein